LSALLSGGGINALISRPPIAVTPQADERLGGLRRHPDTERAEEAGERQREEVADGDGGDRDDNLQDRPQRALAWHDADNDLRSGLRHDPMPVRARHHGDALLGDQADYRQRQFVVGGAWQRQRHDVVDVQTFRQFLVDPSAGIGEARCDNGNGHR
jgi:hypothetical protein